MKTKIVKFTYGTAKDAELNVPAEACSIYDCAKLIRESYLKWIFGHGALMSDECVVSSIGKANFFAGALGGYETRLNAKEFELLKNCADDEMSLAVEVAQFRDPSLSRREAYRIAAKNEALSEDVRKFFNDAAGNDALWANA